MKGAVAAHGDATLYAEDIASIGKGWFTSNAIDFFFSFLPPSSSSSSVAVLPPAASFLVAMSDDAEEAQSCVCALSGLSEAALVLAPVNNQSSMASGDGSHWSLLLFDRAANRFRHFDSCRGANSGPARELATKLGWAVGAREGAMVEEAKEAPQQENGRDCGVFVCMNVESIVRGEKMGENTTEKATKVRLKMLEWAKQNSNNYK